MQAKEKNKTGIFGRIRRLMADMIDRHCLVFAICISPFINLIIEMLSRHSVLKGLQHIFAAPVPFIHNSLLIAVTMVISTLFKKRIFTMLLMACIWLCGGLVNCMLLFMRVTPFCAADFLNIKSAFDVMHIYMKTWQIVLMFASAAVFIIFMVILYIKAPKLKIYYKMQLSVLLIAALIFGGCHIWATGVGYLPEVFGNLADSYRDYGFVYCFVTSVVDQGVDEPDDYSDETVDDILGEIVDDIEPPAVQLNDPNIIIVQLESFFNVNRMKDITFSEDPIPNFTRFMAQNPSGIFTVPSIGAGTVNSEFEVLTGMNLDYFGTGEYPYKTILKESVSPSLCYDLDEYGYSSHAIHNNDGTFYDRHMVYPNLGFDDFTAIEYMKEVRVNRLGWPKDVMLTDQVIKALDSTEGSDFVYGVSVQPHGRYPTERLESDEYYIDVYGCETLEQTNQWRYYANQLHETDFFVAQLVTALESRGEPYIAVFYGDHLPSLDIQNEDLAVGDVFDTDYFIITNTGAQSEKEDIEAYQLSAKVLDMAGLEGGVIVGLHQTGSSHADYQEKLELLEYDILYGEKAVYGGMMPYEPADMKMGLDKIKITSYELTEDALYVTGENLTGYSMIFVNGEPFGDTFKLSPDTLMADDTDLEPGDVITIAQVGNDGYPLSFSDEVVFE